VTLLGQSAAVDIDEDQIKKSCNAHPLLIIRGEDHGPFAEAE
jgi:hypothetical protein